MGRYPWTGPLRPAGEDGRRRVAQAARQFGLEELLDTDCAALSEGQRQMVHLGRAVVQDAPILLLDEPNSALDFYNTQLLFQTVGELIRTQRKAGLVVLHDPALALTWCRRLLLLRRGELVGEICPREATGRGDTGHFTPYLPGYLRQTGQRQRRLLVRSCGKWRKTGKFMNTL